MFIDYYEYSGLQTQYTSGIVDFERECQIKYNYQTILDAFCSKNYTKSSNSKEKKIKSGSQQKEIRSCNLKKSF